MEQGRQPDTAKGPPAEQKPDGGFLLRQPAPPGLRLNGVQNLDVSYDAMGNITSKSDVGVGTWTYHATKKHAVTNAAGNTFTYDANGNQITRNANDVTLTSYNYPSRVENGTRYHGFFYDANRQRWKQVYYNGSSSETTIFVGSILEKHIAGSLTEYRHYIQVGGQAVALYTRPSSGTITTQYLHLDHLGSVAEVTNAAGAIDVSENFDAFGQRRDATDWSGPPASGVLTAIAGVSQRGYTFHTNLESSSLIHMNGRKAGIPEPTTKQLVGHAKESLTYGTYSRGVDVKLLRQAISKVTFGAVDRLVSQ